MDERRNYRVGVMIPSPNTVFERDLALFLPPSVTAHVARLWLDERDTSGRAANRMVDEGLELAAKQLQSVRPDLIFFACTSAAAARGRDGELQLVADIERLTGVKAMSLMEECRIAIRERGAEMVAVITPYGMAATEDVAREVRDLGVAVAKVDTITYESGFAIGEARPDEIAAFAIRSLQGVPLDLAFLSCANWRSTEAAPAIESAIGAPVLTSTRAAVDAITRELGLRQPTAAR